MQKKSMLIILYLFLIEYKLENLADTEYGKVKKQNKMMGFGRNMIMIPRSGGHPVGLILREET